MQFIANSDPSNLESILQRIFTNRRITRQVQHIMQINQVFDGLKKGLIRVVD
ncbi:MAG: hypothetical protein ACKPEO_02520 [Sphaerospermopsis kisseleviana]|uniref:hypothetical protein n=1 Tax=Sphaerospermopsis sp. FACHB-1194 TaxID=2692862 RepID=UPI0016802315|nr:hypothetical protein [Sphaerospermopsis sp. FACHB-1194]MBD2144900.1 hypothetical protein [Sphaerospermopsis sp. FACHB-1194]